MNKTDDLIFSPVEGVLPVEGESKTELPIKPGDVLFIHHRHGVNAYCQVKRISADEIRLYVYNGAYELRLTKGPTTGTPKDYTDAIKLFEEKLGRWRE